MDYIRIYLMDLPHAVRGYTVKNEDDSYSIFLNARLSAQMQKETYDHEMRHIDHQDYGDVNVSYLEKIRHQG